MSLEPGYYWTVRTPACLPIDPNEEPQPRKWDGDGWVAARTRYFWQDFTPVSPRLVWPAWRPISDAPRDGTKIDLMYPYPRGRTINCFWGTSLGPPCWVWRTPAWDSGVLLPEDQWTVSAYPNMEPLFWMPIPEGPKP